MINKKDSEKEAVLDMLEWFLAETDELADLVYDSSTNGKPTDTALAKKVRSRLEAYCAYMGKPLFPFAVDWYDKEMAEILFPEGENETSPLSSGEALTQILAEFLEDIRKLFQAVLTNDPADPHFSAVTAERKAALYLQCQKRPVLYPLISFWQEQGYSREEIQQFYENYRREYPYYTGDKPPYDPGA